MIIDCEGCQMRDLACDDCVVTFLLGPPGGLGSAEQSALAVLADGRAGATAADAPGWFGRSAGPGSGCRLGLRSAVGGPVGQDVPMRVLCVTNDFPPRAGGIQAFVHGVLVRQPEGSVVVYAPKWKGDAAFDAGQPFPVVRHPTSLMLPEPTVLRRAREIARAEGCDRVVFGAAAPLGLLAPRLASAGVHTSVGMTHGHEAAWAQTPGPRHMLRRIGEGLDRVTYLGEYTRGQDLLGAEPRGGGSDAPAGAGGGLGDLPPWPARGCGARDPRTTWPG